MEKVDKKVLKIAANNLLFDMNDDEYDTLLHEFDIITKQMELIASIKGVDDVEPMAFPYPVYGEELREDVAKETLSKEDALKNAGDVSNGMIRLPKVVG